jgi:glycerate 2-kinase
LYKIAIMPLPGPLFQKMEINAIQHASQIFSAAVAAVHPHRLLLKHLVADGNRIIICDEIIAQKDICSFILLSVGKAASAMAQAAENVLGNRINAGLCITKHGHALPLQYCRTIEAGHPTPDENSLDAGKELLSLVANRHPNDVVLLLLSGGASALVSDVPPGCSLQDLQETTQLLVNSGATIQQINCVRKHLSAIKGGGLARAAHPARVFTLIISDVAGDNMDAIASGPTVPDSTSFADALQVVEQYGLYKSLPASILQHLQNGANGLLPDTPKEGDAVFEKSLARIIGSNAIALQAAAREAMELGYSVSTIAENITGNTGEWASKMVRDVTSYNSGLPACMLAGGETTLHVTGNGKGGRAQHLALAALAALQHSSAHAVTLLSAGTDGTDGPTDAAGAVVSNQLPADTAEIQEHLARFDAYSYFERHGGLIKTGPTQTNVMDVIIGLIHPK